MIYKIANPLDKCALKFAKDASSEGEFEGYGSVFDSNDLSGDTVLKGTYVDSIKKGLPSMFINHNHGMIPPGDFVEASEDSTGLLLKGKIDLNHSDGPSLYSAMLRKAMKGLSIGAPLSSLVFEKKTTGGRIISKMNLKEVSVVTWPMEEQAQISIVKSDIESIENFKDLEAILRDAGFSKSAAMVFMSRAKTLTQRDAGVDEGKIINDCTPQLIKMINNFQIGASRNG